MNNKQTLLRPAYALGLVLMFCGLGLKSWSQTYCTPTYTFGCTDDYIASFSTSGGATNITNVNSGPGGASCLSNQTTMVHTAAVGSTVNFSVVNNPDYEEGYKIFVDWNEDGDFSDPDEVVYSPTTVMLGGASATGSFIIPAGTQPGNKRMRVRCVYDETNFDACSSEDYGETEDYTLAVSSAAACVNPPAAGTVASSVPDSVCPSINFALTTSGTATGSGMAYQWEQSPTGAAGTWTDLIGATTINYTLSSGITANTYFRLKVICSGGTPAYSNTHLVSLKSIQNCYCTPQYIYGCSNGGTIDGFATTGANVNLSNLNTGCASGASGYSDYTSITMSAVQALSFDFSVDISAYGSGVKIWADWNQDGIFDPVTELCAASSAVINAGNTYTGTITLPITALTGPTRLRVRAIEGSTSFDPCGTDYYGETEDYTINVVAIAACVNPPDPGIIAASVPDSVCPNISFTLATTGTTLGAGMDYQWEQSATGTAGSWSALAGATSVHYTISAGITTNTYYRLKSVCSGGSPVYSDEKLITIKNFINCYCTPTYTYGCANGGTIDGFETYAAMTDVSNLNTGCASGGIGYSDYSALAVTAAHSFPFNADVHISAYGSGVRIWADWNHDGIFDPVTELCAASATVIPAGSVYSTTITPPATALLGATRLRVRAVEGSTSFNPCSDYYYGETEDYTIVVVNPPACSTVTMPATVQARTAPGFLCLSGDADLDITTALPSATGLTYQWQSAPAAAGPWSNIGGPAATLATTVNGISSTTYYRLQVLCDGGLVLTSDADSVVVGNPGTLNVTDNERCGPGAVQLEAMPLNSGSDVVWYENLTGGVPLATGNSFITPSLNTTTTYYAAALAGATQYITGKLNPSSIYGANWFGDVGLMFDAQTAFTLESVDVYPVGTPGTGTVTIVLKNASGAILNSATETVNVTANGVANTVPLNFAIPAGTDYRLVVASTSGVDELIYEAFSGFNYPYTEPNVCSITAAYDGGAISYYYYFFYRWVVKIGCESSRVPVVATINPVPVPDMGPDIDTCLDEGKMLTLDPGLMPDNPVYAWDNGLHTQTRSIAQSGTYEVGVTNMYGCTARDTINVVMRWNPQVFLEAGGTDFCLGGTKTLDAGAGGENGGSYYWNTGETSRTIDIDNTGTYIVYVTSPEGCLTIDTVDIVSSGYMPEVDGIMTQPLSASSFSLSAVNPQNVTTFIWNYGDGATPDTIPATSSTVGVTTHDFISSGTYNVQLTTLSTCGEVMDSTMITIIGLGINDRDPLAGRIQIYPNPNRGDYFYITVDGDIRVEELTFLNALGQELLRTTVHSSGRLGAKVALPAGLASGAYTVQIRTNKGTTTQKLQVVR